MRTLICLLCLLSASVGMGQTLYTGRVVDAETNQPLSYVRLSWRQAKRGTLSNAQGAYRLQAASPDDTLEVFVLGYELRRILPEQLPTRDAELRLHPEPLTLQAVEILSISAQELLRRALARVPDNYPNASWSWQGFYREIEDWNFSRYIEGRDTLRPQRAITIGEALVRVVMPSYAKRGDPQVKLLKGRLIRPEARRQDSLDEAILNLAEGLEEKGGPPQQAAFDVARNPSQLPFFDKRADKWFDFSLRGVLPYQGRPTYRIDIAQKAGDGSKKSLLDGTVYLDSASLAFVSIAYHLSEEAAQDGPSGGLLGIAYQLTDLQGRIEYRRLGDTWTLAYNHFETALYFGIPQQFALKRDLAFDSELRFKSEMLLNTLESRDASPIPRDQRFLNREALGEEIGSYDASYWAGQEILPLEATLWKEER